MPRTLLWLVPAVFGAHALLACATTSRPTTSRPTSRARPPIVAGELLIRTADPSALGTEGLQAATGREDFQVRSAECLPTGSCRVVVERVGELATEDWTWELIDALAARKPPGVKSVEPNAVSQPRTP